MVELRETAAETRSGSVKGRRCNAIDVMGIERLAHSGDVFDIERMNDKSPVVLENDKINTSAVQA